MDKIIARRFLLRDDGTGRGRESEVSLAEFLNHEAIVILGDPGIGKTTLLKQLAPGSYQKVRGFLAEPQLPPSGILFLDALDEYRNSASNQDAILDVTRALCVLHKPQFRLSCRAADWFGSVDNEVLKAGSASGRIVVLELLPLNDGEIAQIVFGLVPNPSAFLEEARAAGLGPLLGNPQTLELIARAWRGDQKPRNKFDAYQLGIAELLKEANPAHVLRGAQPDLFELRTAAAAAAATLLLANKDCVSRIEVTDADDELLLSDIPCENKNHLDSALKRRIFSTTKEDRFEFIHRTIQEFLAAGDIAARIARGLPVDRALALICGRDGVPVSSLRGLYAWLMCHLGSRATAYVDRDPYAVAAYGDASTLPPEAQKGLWHSLRNFTDPWFLAGEDHGASFHHLANPNTAGVLAEILSDNSASPHLQVAALEAIASADRDLGLNHVVRQIIVNRQDNAWLRITALKALDNIVKRDFEILRDIDIELSMDRDDDAGAQVRLEILKLSFGKPNLAERTLSVLEHSTRKKGIVGGLHILGTEFPDSEIDAVLRGASEVLKPDDHGNYEAQAFFEYLLSRRLADNSPLDVNTLARTLLTTQRQGDPEKNAVLRSLKNRLTREPSLLNELFDALVAADAESFWSFLAFHLWQVMPSSIWPVVPSAFFLEKAEREPNIEKAADLYRIFVSWFPSKDGYSTLAQAGFDFLEQHPDVARLLREWNVNPIDEWRLDQNKRRSESIEKKAAGRDRTIEYLMPRLSEVASAANQRALEWGAGVFLGLYIDVDGDTPGKRFRDAANPEIEAACIQGFMTFAEREDLPNVQQIIDCWSRNQIPYRHILLNLSIYFREVNGLTIPTRAEPACAAAVITGLSGEKIPGFKEKLWNWLKRIAQQTPSVVAPVLHAVWLSERGNLYGFHELSAEPALSSFLASVAADVLRSPRCDENTVQKLVPVIFKGDPETAEAIGRGKLCDPCLSGAQRAIWVTALYLHRPAHYGSAWRLLDSQPNESFWAVMETISSRWFDAVSTAQRTEIIATVGKRFPYAEFPKSGGGWGRSNAWDASNFVTKQIEHLATDPSQEASQCLASLERDPGLSSYLDYIRHQHSQQGRLRRELSFVVPSTSQVRQALMNLAPATPSDLLAYIENHLTELSFELTRTQKERYRAYWNERGREIFEPKREEVCSGLLAEDLQNRVSLHGLIVTVEHHMVDDKECDVVVLQGQSRMLPIEVKHQYHADLWTAWGTQLQKLYTRDAGAGDLGIYLILWSGRRPTLSIPKPPDGLSKPTSPEELKNTLQSLIPSTDRQRLRVVVVDISPADR